MHTHGREDGEEGDLTDPDLPNLVDDTKDDSSSESESNADSSSSDSDSDSDRKEAYRDLYSSGTARAAGTEVKDPQPNAAAEPNPSTPGPKGVVSDNPIVV